MRDSALVVACRSAGLSKAVEAFAFLRSSAVASFKLRPLLPALVKRLFSIIGGQTSAYCMQSVAASSSDSNYEVLMKNEDMFINVQRLAIEAAPCAGKGEAILWKMCNEFEAQRLRRA